MAGRLICLIGIDGAGKTTQARWLVEDLRAAGIDVDYCYGRTLPYVTQWLVGIAKRAFMRDTSAETDFAEYTRQKRALMEHGVLARLYSGAMQLEYLMQAVAKIVLPRRFGRHLVCDRYAYDTIVTDLYNDLGYGPEDAQRVTDRFLALLGAPDLAIYLQLDEATAMVRKDDVPDIQYLRERRQTYDAIAARYHMHIVPADRPPDEVRAAIGELVRPLFAPSSQTKASFQPPSVLRG